MSIFAASRMNRRAVLAGASALTIAAASSGRAAEPLQIVATTGMIADAARAVGGDAVAVRALMGPGVDPHGYRQTRSDIVALTRADLVLWHGLYLEAQMEAFLLDLGRRKPVVAVGEAAPRARLRANEDYADRFDPHIWMDPSLWTFAVDAAGAAMASVRPEDAAAFSANAGAYKADLGALDAYARAVLATVPEQSRVLISAHDAFGYFGAAHGFEVIGVQGISTESEAGLTRIAAMVDLIVERRIKAVFVETSVSDRNMRALIEGASARGHAVAIGGDLYSDAMGPEGTYEGTYLGMIDHNVTVIARALGGDAPAGGMRGMLAQS